MPARCGGRNYFIPAALFLLGFVLWHAEARPQGVETGIFIEEEMQLRLGDHFLREGDPERAITEYRRFLFFFPQSLRGAEALLKIGRAYFQGERYAEAIRAGDEFLKKFPSSPLLPEVLLLKGLSFAGRREFVQARHYFKALIEKFPDSPWSDEARRQRAYTFIKEERWKEAAEEFRRVGEASRWYSRSQALAKGLDRIRDVPQKSPGTAGFLAAVLPGAGHFYVERYRDATVAFLLNGAFIWAIIESFERRNYAVGAILTFFELGWYSGNIYGAVSGAHKYNRKKRHDYLNILEREQNFSWGIIPGGKTPFLCLRYDF